MARQTYTGSCQCGAVRYDVEADLAATFICNCSRCKRLGAVLVFVPLEQFHLTHNGPVTSFTYAGMVVEHRFCPTCGVESYATSAGPDGIDMVAVNVNCLDGVDARALHSLSLNGHAA